MSVRFVLGRAGTGKTRHLIQNIEALHRQDPLGPPIYWLLPKQATFQAERLLTASIGAFTRVRIVSFDLLGREILTACGDVGIPEVTTLGRRMVIGLMLRKHRKELKFYSASAHRPGLAAELDSTFGEFERAGLDSAALQALLENTATDPASGEVLVDKLRDVRLLLEHYNQYIGQERLDPARRLQLILRRVASCGLLRDAVLFVDDFYDFTAYERQLLTALAGVVGRTEIALLLDPDHAAADNLSIPLDELSVFHRTERTYRSLLVSLREAGVTVEPAVQLATEHRFDHPDLRLVERELFTNSPESRTPADAVEWFDAPDARTEIDGVARRIRKCLATGMRYRDIAVLMRNLGDYQEIINASFLEHDLPYFADTRRTAGHHPLLQMVRACLSIARHRWPHEAVMMLVKSGLAGVNDSEADELENYVLQHRIRGRYWESHEPWNFVRDLTRGAESDADTVPELTETTRLDAIRRGIVEKLAPLLQMKTAGEDRTVREFATALFATLSAFGVTSTLGQWMSAAEAAGRFEQRDEHEQVWANFTDLFEHMVELIGTEPVSLTSFNSILDSGLESFDLALTPPTVDQIVVGQIDRTRTPDVKVVFVVGLIEGGFPHAASEKCVLTDNERRSLRGKNIDLDPDSERRLLDERFLAYLAFTRSSHRLVLSRPLANASNRATIASSFWGAALALFPATPLQHAVRASQYSTDSIGTARQLVSTLVQWVRAGAQFENSDLASLYEWTRAMDETSVVSRVRDRAWPALNYKNAAALERAVSSELFVSPLKATAAQLETVAACPFRHFAKYGLKLRGRDDSEVTRIDLSNAYHDVLENLVRDMVSSRQDWCSVPADRANDLIKTHVSEIGRRLRGELMLSNARNQYLLDRIERTLERAVAAMTETHRRGKFRPAHAGLRFGENGKLSALSVITPAGDEVRLSGRIDRVDTHQEAGTFVVADYKFSTGPLALDKVYHGLSLQLLTYLLVVQAGGERLAGRPLTPAAAFLLPLLRSPETVDHPSKSTDPEDPSFHLRVRARGLVNAKAIADLDTALTAGQSEVLQVYVNKGGDLGRLGSSDSASEAELAALLKHVETRLGELADQVLQGDVAARPFMIGDTTPCPHCEYRAVCRFEPGINHYRMLPSMKREQVLLTVSGAAPE